MRTLLHVFGGLVLASACGCREDAVRAPSREGVGVAMAAVVHTDARVEEASIERDATPSREPDAGPRLEDPSGRALTRFFRALARSEAGQPGAVTRVLHMGDSSIGLDGLPHAIRRRMQDRFGDAGAGFVLLDRYSPNYKSNVAGIQASGWNICYIAYLCHGDGHYGLGGHSFRGPTGAWSKIGPVREGQHGRTTSLVELWYAAMPRGGALEVRIDGQPRAHIETQAEALEDRWHRIDVARGEHTVEIRAAGHGNVRAFGVVLENEGPGVVWDTVSMIGAFTKRLHGYDDEHIAAQLRHRDPDLLVLNYGGNDLRRVVTGSLDGPRYEAEYRVVLEKLLASAAGERSCLLVSVVDHGRSGNQTVKPEHVVTMVEAQRRVAFAHGCAFFDSVAAMGGPGSLRTWLQRTPRLAEPDLKHLNHRGRDAMGQMMVQALMDAYAMHGHAAAR